MKKGDTPLKAIRLHCLECSGGRRKEVRFCQIPHCHLYPYRFGNNPKRKGKGKISNVYTNKTPTESRIS